MKQSIADSDDFQKVDFEVRLLLLEMRVHHLQNPDRAEFVDALDLFRLLGRGVVNSGHLMHDALRGLDDTGLPMTILRQNPHGSRGF